MHLVERHTLALVDGDRIRKAQWQLLERSHHGTRDGLRGRIEFVAELLPRLLRDAVHLAADLHEAVRVAKTGYNAKRTVDPPARRIVADHHHPRPGLELQHFLCRKRLGLEI